MKKNKGFISILIAGAMLLLATISAGVYLNSEEYKEKGLLNVGDTVTPLPVRNFLGLTDTPNSYSGQANKIVSVNGAGTALEFTTAGSGIPTQITVADTTDSTSFVGLFESATGDLAPKTDGGLLYDASNSTLTATTFSGALSGNASTASALFANGANCSSGSAPLGVGANGAVESCFDVWTEAENTAAGYTTLAAVAGVGYFDNIEDFTGTLTDTKICTYDQAGGEIDCATDASAGGAPTDVDYLVGTASGGLSAEIVVGTSPGGELGGTWASPTLDDNITTTGWVMGTFTGTTLTAGTINADLFDAVGAVDMDFGSVDITDMAFVTDGTGDAEIVLPDASIGATELDADSVSSSELNATGVEAELEAVLDLQELQGAVTDGQVPNSITIDSALSVEGTDLGTLTDGKFCTYDLTGTEIDCASDAPTPTTITVADTTDTTSFVGLWTDATGDLAPKTDAGLTYNATTGMLTATGLTGPLTGNASTATALAADPADCGANAFATTIAASGALTCASIADADVPNNITIDLATLASTVTVVDSTDATSFVAMFDSATGSLAPKTDGGLLYASDTGTLAPTILSTATVTLTGTGTINGLDAVDATGEDTIEALIFDADAQNITGVWEVQDDINFNIGNTADWMINFDDSVDDQLLFATNANGAIATTDPMLEILADFDTASGSNMVANQEIFGVAKGTQASNVSLFTVDEDGDGLFAGTLGVTGGLTIDGNTETNIEAAIDIAGDVTGTGLGSVVIADNSVDGTDIALGSDAQGDIMYYDGTNYVRLAKGTASQQLRMNAGATAPEWFTPAAAGTTYKNGETTRDIAAASGTQNIAHGLGTTPKNVRITGTARIANVTIANAYVVYNGTTRSSSYSWHETGSATTEGAGNGFIFSQDGSNGQTGVVTFDSTNIIITWTKNGGTTGTAYLTWEAES